jgi:putative copper export protein
MDNVFVKSFFDFLHLLATIAWFGTLFVNIVILRGAVQKSLTPAVAGPFMKVFMQKARIVVYVSLAILFITGIPLKIVSPYYVSIINFSNTWQIFMFAKHVLVAILALMAIVNFEIIAPNFQKIAARGPSSELDKMKKMQLSAGMFSAGLAFIIILISAVMNHI